MCNKCTSFSSSQYFYHARYCYNNEECFNNSEEKKLCTSSRNRAAVGDIQYIETQVYYWIC